MIILIISQVLNNNVLLVEDEKNQGKIIWGRGIGFKAHSGQNYKLQPRDKVFESTRNYSNESSNSTEIPKKYLRIAMQLIDFAEKKTIWFLIKMC